LKNTALSGALFTAIIVHAVCYVRVKEQRLEKQFQVKAES